MSLQIHLSMDGMFISWIPVIIGMGIVIHYTKVHRYFHISDHRSSKDKNLHAVIMQFERQKLSVLLKN